MKLDQTLILADGRTLGYSEAGDLKGEPLILFHGLHSSRLEVKLFSEKMKKNGIRLIGIDRAGIGLSTFQTNRTVVNTVNDLLTLTDALAIDRFSVIGISSGAKYALACAYKIPHKLKNVFCLSSGVPIEYINDDIPKESRKVLKIIQKYPQLIKPLFWFLYARHSQKKCSHDLFLTNIILPLDAIDKSLLFDNMELKKQFILQCQESYTRGVSGNAYDARFDMLEVSWGFKLEDIDFKHIHIYHGTKDKGSPIYMAKILEEKIDHATFYEKEEGHLTLIFNVIDEVIYNIRNI